MRKITLETGKKNLPRRYLRYFYLSIAFPSLLTSIWLQGLRPTQLQAKATPTSQQVRATNSWQHASFPVENFQAYTSGFGYRKSPVTGKLQFHRGLDMAAPIGSYVRNWWTGHIVELSDGTGCGTTIKIRSGKWTHVYCHLNGYVTKTPEGTFLVDRQGGIQLRVGQQIPVGARIGRVGMTGRTTGPHLHWSLLYENKYVNPALVLQEMHKHQASLPASGWGEEGIGNGEQWN